MGRPSKFKEGMKVVSILKHDEYEIIEVKRNTLVVRPTDKIGLVYTCTKSMFEVLTDDYYYKEDK